MTTSDNTRQAPISRRDFVRAASLAATAAATCASLSSIKGQPPATGGAPECSPVPTGATVAPGARSGLLQREAPLAAIGEHVCGLHFYSGDISRQVVAQHYCAHVSGDVRQCVIYDSDRKHARLVGIEYIISARLFEGLPAEEKGLWHSHVYEVKSGQLIAPGIPEAAERQVMQGLVGTYGKTWYTWQTDRDDRVPLGIPQLMMAFTADGQVDPRLLADRDRDYGTVSEEERKARAGIIAPAVGPGADAWQGGEAIQLRATVVKMNGA